MIHVRMADEKNLDIAEVEAQLLDALLDLRRGAFEVAVDEDVSLRRGDQ